MLALHMERHGDTAWHLHKAIIGPKGRIDRKIIVHRVAGTKVPRSVTSMEILSRIETRYRLPSGYFAAKLPHTGRAGSGHYQTRRDEYGGTPSDGLASAE
ncbi:MAG TPA: hypothetical protein VN047_05245 [Sphingopyxis sp.]|nr:hypothetical protein [Sphingopyxis sp.]